MSYTPKRNSNNDNYGDSYYKTSSKSSNYEDIYSSSRKCGKSKKLPISLMILSIVFAIIGGIMVYGYNMLNSVNYDDLSNTNYTTVSNDNSFVKDTNISLTSGALLNDPMVLNVLLFGSDSYSAGDGGRTDTMLMLSIDNRHKKLKLTSFMRDLWVNIPGYGEQRLNVAYAVGGPKLSIETIERNFGIDVDRYVVVDFVGFEGIVNRLGGIDIELAVKEVAYINQHSSSKNKLSGSGIKHLDGNQALQHARNRDSIGSDFDRTLRQRKVISCIVEKFKTANLSQITGIVADIGPMLTTNLKKSEISTLVTNSLTYLNYDIEEFRLPENDNYSSKNINGASVLCINNITKARKDLAKFIYEDSVQG